MRETPLSYETSGCSYRVINEQCRHIDIGDYSTYGIMLTCSDFEQTIHDITLQEEKAASLVGLFNAHQLDPVHFMDAVLDFVDAS